jgi:putative aldouronate transport system permease protein
VDKVKRRSSRKRVLRTLRKDFEVYLYLLPGLLALLIFRYAPMYGVVIAFKDYNILAGIRGSPWVGLEHFREILHTSKFYSVVSNTILINIYRIIFYFPLPIILAIMINELASGQLRRIVQTIVSLPYFLSWVIIASIFINILSLQTGLVNQVIAVFGIKPILFMAQERYFRAIVVVSNAWYKTGWTSIIYLAAIQGINIELYDAAKIDGASKWHEIWYVTLPGIITTIVFMFMLHLAYITRDDVEQILMLYNPMVYRVGDVIGTYIYRIGIGQLQFSQTTAIGLFQSIIGLFLIGTANVVSKRVSSVGIW